MCARLPVPQAACQAHAAATNLLELPQGLRGSENPCLTVKDRVLTPREVEKGGGLLKKPTFFPIRLKQKCTKLLFTI